MYLFNTLPFTLLNVYETGRASALYQCNNYMDISPMSHHLNIISCTHIAQIKKTIQVTIYHGCSHRVIVHEVIS